jgi:hypothetical protein
MPVGLKDTDRIFARSPYYINCVPSVGKTIQSASLTVEIQTGQRSSLASPPMTTVKQYDLSKSNAIDGIIVFDIAPLIADYFDQDATQFDATADTTYPNYYQSFFVYVTKTVTHTDTSTSVTNQYYSAWDGYSEYKDGVNYLPSTGATGNYGDPDWTNGTGGTYPYETDVTIMATNCYRQIGEDSYALLGLFMGAFDTNNLDLATIARIKFGAGSENWKTDEGYAGSDKYDIDISGSDSRLGEPNEYAVYIPIGKKNLGANWQSTDLVQVQHSMLKANLTGLPTIGTNDLDSVNDQPVFQYHVICEPKYNVIDCLFVNKWGAWDSFSFLKRSNERISVTDSMYNSSIGEVVSEAYTYDQTKHIRKRFNTQGKRSISVNTGYVQESFNLLLEEMIVSDTIYLIIDDVIYPVNINTKSIELRKSVNDKLINYTLDFDFAYDKIQTFV